MNKSLFLLLLVLFIPSFFCIYEIRELDKNIDNNYKKIDKLYDEEMQSIVDSFEEYGDCVQEGYEVFLDGELIEADNIDIDYYKFSISHADKKIYLTKELLQFSDLHRPYRMYRPMGLYFPHIVSPYLLP